MISRLVLSRGVLRTPFLARYSPFRSPINLTRPLGIAYVLKPTVTKAYYSDNSHVNLTQENGEDSVQPEDSAHLEESIPADESVQLGDSAHPEESIQAEESTKLEDTVQLEDPDQLQPYTPLQEPAPAEKENDDLDLLQPTRNPTYRKIRPADEGMDRVDVLAEPISVPFLGKSSPILVMRDLIPPPLSDDILLKKAARLVEKEERIRKMRNLPAFEIIPRPVQAKQILNPAELSNRIITERLDAQNFDQIVESIDALRPQSLAAASSESEWSSVISLSEAIAAVMKLKTGFLASHLKAYIEKFGPAKISAGTPAPRYIDTELKYGILRRSSWYPSGILPTGSTPKQHLAIHLIRSVWNVGIREELIGVGSMDVQILNWQLELLMNRGNAQTSSILDRIANERQAKLEIWKQAGHGKYPIIRFTTDRVHAIQAYEDLEKYLSSIEQMDLLLPPNQFTSRSLGIERSASTATKALRDYVMFSEILANANVVAPVSFSLPIADFRRLMKITPSIKVLGTKASHEIMVRGLLSLIDYPSVRVTPTEDFPPHEGENLLRLIDEAGTDRPTSLLPSSYYQTQFPTSLRSLAHQFRREGRATADSYPSGLLAHRILPSVRKAAHIMSKQERDYRKQLEATAGHEVETYASIGHILLRSPRRPTTISNRDFNEPGSDHPTESISSRLGQSMIDTRLVDLISGKELNGLAHQPANTFIPHHPGFLRVARRLESSPGAVVKSSRIVKAVFEPSPLDYESLLPKRASAAPANPSSAAAVKLAKMQDAIYSVLEQPRLEILFEVPTEVPSALIKRSAAKLLREDGHFDEKDRIKVISASLVQCDLRAALQIPALSHDAQIVRRFHHPLAIDPADSSRSSAVIRHLSFLHTRLPSMSEFLSDPSSVIPHQITLLPSEPESSAVSDLEEQRTEEVSDDELLQMLEEKEIVEEEEVEEDEDEVVEVEEEEEEVEAGVKTEGGVGSDSEYRLIDCSLVETTHFLDTKAYSFHRQQQEDTQIQGSPLRFPKPTADDPITVSFVRTTSLLKPSFSTQGGPPTPRFGGKAAVDRPPPKNYKFQREVISEALDIDAENRPTFTSSDQSLVIGPQWEDPIDHVQPIEEVRITGSAFPYTDVNSPLPFSPTPPVSSSPSSSSSEAFSTPSDPPSASDSSSFPFSFTDTEPAGPKAHTKPSSSYAPQTQAQEQTETTQTHTQALMADKKSAEILPFMMQAINFACLIDQAAHTAYPLIEPFVSNTVGSNERNTRPERTSTTSHRKNY